MIAAERRRRLLDELKLSRVREEQEKQRAEIEAKIRAEQAERERIRLMEEAMIRQQELAIQARYECSSCYHLNLCSTFFQDFIT